MPTLQHWHTLLTDHLAAMAEEDGAHDINHFHRVWAVAQQLLDAYPEADAQIVLAASYLHDLVNPPKNHPDRSRASRLSAVAARELLTQWNFPAGKLDGVAHAIEAHSFSAAIPARTLEARIVQDADRMDALGAVGLARMFYTAGRMACALAHGSDPLAENRALDDKAYSLDHIAVKLSKLPDMMQTEAGRRLADERVAWMNGFKERFAAEWLPRPD